VKRLQLPVAAAKSHSTTKRKAEGTVVDIFGSVADLYETTRPGYPPALADAILAYHGGVPASVVEIGTGKGTEVLARLVAPLTCIEPDLRMAAVRADKFPQAAIHVDAFERWSPPACGVGVVACAMAWHWLPSAT
jgi:hypothetical protein